MNCWKNSLFNYFSDVVDIWKIESLNPLNAVNILNFQSESAG